MESGLRDDALSIEDVSLSEETHDSVYAEDNDIEDENLTIQSNQPCSQNTQKKKRKKRSTVWKFMKELSKREDGTSIMKCKLCKETYEHDLRQGTSNMRRHLRFNCDQRHEALKILTPVAGRDTRRRLPLNQVAFRECLAQSVVMHEYPFQYVEHKGTRSLFSLLNADVKFISRNTIKSDIMKMYYKEKKIVESLIRATPGRICLTSDMWSSPTTDGFMGITSHFIDEEWKLHKKILNFMYMPAPHSGEVILAKFSELMIGWGIEDKLFSITLDNASANTTFSNSYETRLNLKNALLLGGRFFRVRCCAHILNLIVQDGLKEVDESLFKIRETVKYLKNSQARKEKFVQCLNNLELQGPKRLRQDVSVRWNSTYLMIERALLFRPAFPEFALCDVQYKMCPSKEEWLRLEKISKFLKLFYDLTNLFSGTTYPTSNLYFQSVWRIQLHLNEALESNYGYLRSMAIRMKGKFDKYWSDFSDILSIAMVLDPRYKMRMIEYSYNKLYGRDDGKIRSDRVREQLHSLFDEYVSLCSVPHPNDPIRSSSVIQVEGDDLECDDEMRGFDSFQNQTSQENKSQLEVYLEETCHGWRQPLDVLVYWKSIEYRFPELAKMARDVLTIPISTVASEAAFSLGGRILDQYRSSLAPSVVEALVCTKDWMFGSNEIKTEDDDLDVDLLDGSSSFPSTSRSSSITSRVSSSKRTR